MPNRTSQQAESQGSSRALPSPDWNETAVEYPRDQCVHQLFEESVKQWPEKPAVVHRNETLSYSQVNGRANQLAHFLIDSGIQPQERIAVCLNRHPDLIVSLLAILKCGGVYVPLDPSYPQDRVNFMLNDIEPIRILTHSECCHKIGTEHTNLLLLDRDPIFQNCSTENPKVACDAEQLAYIMYTSGSTGQPKGVAVKHRGIVRMFFGVDYVDLDAPQTFLQLSSICFDASTFEIWGALLRGHQLVLFDDSATDFSALGEAIHRHQVSCILLTASLFNAIIDERPEILQNVRQILAGAEALSVRHIQKAQRLLPDTKLINAYGPTENTTITCSYRIPKQFEPVGSIPIGRPIGNSKVYILDEYKNLVPIGDAGELFVGGDGLASGYWKLPDLTAEKFIADPFDPSSKSKLYRTGDRCRYLADGRIEFLGRIDTQLKIRGFRIEPGEIETHLVQHQAIREAAVVASPTRLGSNQLVAFCVPQSSSELTPNELKQFLRTKLPAHMIPGSFYAIERMPLTSSGKLDRRALLCQYELVQSSSSDTSQPPTTKAQEIVLNIVQSVISQQNLGLRDDFFECGAHSLSIARIVHRIRQKGYLVSIRDIFENPTTEELARLLETNSRNESRVLDPAVELSRSNINDQPASAGQSRMWYAHHLEPENPVYNVAVALRLDGFVDQYVLEKSLKEIIRRHGSLRTTFRIEEEILYQNVAETTSFELPVIDHQDQLIDNSLEPNEIEPICAEAIVPFNLETGPLYRFQLHRFGAEQQILSIVFHHIITDGWSMDIFFRELSANYAELVNGNELSNDQLNVQYVDFANWHQQWLTQSAAIKQREYWAAKLSGANSGTEIWPDNARPAIQTFVGRRESSVIDSELTRRVKDFCSTERKTLFTTLYSVFLVLLHRYTGQADITIGTVTANRLREEFESTIGCFVNTLILRSDISANPKFRKILDGAKETLLQAFSNQDLPFDELVRLFNVTRDASRHPCFQILFVLQNAHTRQVELPGLDVRCNEISTGTSKFDLTFYVEELNEELVVTLEYNSDLYRKTTICRLLKSYQELIDQAMRSPDCRVSEFRLTNCETDQIEAITNQRSSSFDYPRESCIHELFEQQVQKTPQAIALVFENETTTYLELNQRANQLAHFMIKNGIRPGSLIGVCLDRTPDMIVAYLAILKAGCGYVPLDPDHPAMRIAFVVQDTQLDLVITTSPHFITIEKTQADWLCLDKEWLERQHAYSTENPNVVSKSNNVAYVMFTSGSTGNPKGVAIPHRGVARLVFGVDYVDLTGDQTFLQLASPGFDAATFEIWAALLHGHRLVLFPGDVPTIESLERTLVGHDVTCLWLTASLFNVIIDEAPKILSGVKQLLTGGEALSVAHVRRAVQLLPNTVLINGYGPTENTTFTCCYQIPRQLNQGLASISIGRPIGNTQVYILDDQGNHVPFGIPGELCAGGDGLALGYLNHPHLTAEKFVKNPFDSSGETILYKTGDRCRYLPDGTIEFLGRLDNQIKIRGHRIELGEIEQNLVQHHSIGQAIVVVDYRNNAADRLLAFVVANKNELNESDIRSFLAERLPNYMVPNSVEIRQELPLTKNGKIDRKALAGAKPQTERSEPCRPQTPMEKRVAKIFAELLNLESVSPSDNFFDCGGSSLQGVKLIHRLERQLGIRIPLSTLFRAQTVSAISNWIDSGKADESPSLIVEIAKGKNDERLFLLPGGEGNALGFKSLADELELDQTICAMEYPDLDEFHTSERSIEQLATKLISEIRKVQPMGPYCFAGYSLGGQIAFELAVRLQLEGEKIQLLAVVAAHGPGLIRSSKNRFANFVIRLADFARIPLSYKIQYVPFKTFAAAKHIWKAFVQLVSTRNRRNSNASDPEQIANLSTKKINQAIRAIQHYSPNCSFDGDLLLIRESIIKNPFYKGLSRLDAGWAKHIRGEVFRHEINCEHANIIKQPNVQRVAEIIQTFLHKPIENSDSQRKRKGVSDTFPRIGPDRFSGIRSTNDELLMQELRVFSLDLTEFTESLGELNSFLSSDEQNRAANFRRQNDRDSYVVRRGLLRQFLGSYLNLNPSSIEFVYDENGRPALNESQNSLDLDFNISCSHNVALFAFGRNVVIGVDIERLSNGKETFELAKSHFSVVEHKQIVGENSMNDALKFFKLWCCKEAYIKARGIIPMDKFSIDVASGENPTLIEDQVDHEQVGRWHFAIPKVPQGFVASLVADKPNMRICHRELSQSAEDQ